MTWLQMLTLERNATQGLETSEGIGLVISLNYYQMAGVEDSGTEDIYNEVIKMVDHGAQKEQGSKLSGNWEQESKSWGKGQRKIEGDAM